MRWTARWRTRIQPDAIAVTGSGRRRLQRSLSADGGHMTMAPFISAGSQSIHSVVPIPGKDLLYLSHRSRPGYHLDLFERI